MALEELKHTSELIVSEEMTASAMGSGDMEVLATPAMVALMENAAMLAVAPSLDDGYTTVGGYIEVSHLRPSKRGDKIKATASVTKIDGKKIEFNIQAFGNGELIGEGHHYRFIVERKKFLERLK